MAALINEIDEILETVRRGRAGIEKPWGGAEVIVCETAPKEAAKNSWYADKRYVETKFVGEVSWLFIQFRNVFEKQDGFGSWKEEFFGRLGNVVTKFQSAVVGASSEQILEAVVHEAYAMAEEIIDYGEIETLPVTFDNTIMDDFLGTSDLSAYLGSAATLEYLKQNGLA
jgi:hypothetical protein